MVLFIALCMSMVLLTYDPVESNDPEEDVFLELE